MDYLKIRKSTLSGSVDISGSKNATLPLLAMSILGDTPTSITNLPDVKDINTFLVLLKNLGAKVTKGKNSVVIDAKPLNNTKATYDIVKQMRASILVLGPLLSRFGHCEVSLPGGCAIGQRPIDLHLKAMEKMGAKIELKQGYVVATAPDGLKGCEIVFDKVTVGGTENTLLAASLANGVTKIINAAKEPEIVQLCEELQKAGVDIQGIGTSELAIKGTNGKLLSFSSIDVIADRIEAATYLCAAGITNSCITLNKVNPDDMSSILNKLEEMGFIMDKTQNTITIHKNENIKPVKIITKEYPGFPTDVQAQFMALAAKASGVSIIEERLFENRFMHVSELLRMGADISLKDRTATIIGKKELKAADVMATDLRASASLVIAALSCEDETNVHRIYHLDRGYERLEEKLQSLGANIQRLSTDG